MANNKVVVICWKCEKLFPRISVSDARIEVKNHLEKHHPRTKKKIIDIVNIDMLEGRRFDPFD